MDTHFLPPERVDIEVAQNVSEKLYKKLAPWFDAVPVSVLVLNSHRQILYCNQSFRSLAKRVDVEEVIGLRPGEALRCLNAEIMEAGCGTSKFCSVCGAAIAILKSLRGEEDCQECNIIRRENSGESPLDIQVFTKPVELEGHALSLVTCLDISHEKRLRYLKRRFYHDMINTAGGMVTLMSIINNELPPKGETYELLVNCSRRVLQEVLYLRDVTAAEEGRLSVDPEEMSLNKLLNDLKGDFAELAANIQVKMTLHLELDRLVTDQRLLRHALSCLIQNALEACAKGDDITITSEARDDGVEITVKNPGEIPENIRLQLFKRYISSKGHDRGLGVYIAKKIVKDYLGGELDFTTRDNEVSFMIRLPLKGVAS